MGKVDWETSLDQIIATSTEGQIERDQYEQSILNSVNSSNMPSKNPFAVESVTPDSTKLIDTYGNSPEFVHVLDGILVRTSQQRENTNVWSLENGLTTSEMGRRLQILKQLTYRRQVLKMAYELTTGQKWSLENSSAVSVLDDIRRAESEARQVEGKQDFSDQLI